MSDRPLKIFAGSSHPELANWIVKPLEIPLSKIHLGKFANQETIVRLDESVRGTDTFIIQTGCGEINDMVMELLLIINACKKAAAYRISVIIPNFPYARQDRAIERSPISAKLVANMLSTAGADNVITMELHAPQLTGFFDIPIDNLCADNAFATWIRQNIHDWENITLVSPDAGGTKRVLALADLLNVRFAVIHKERAVTNEVANMLLIGDVENRTVIVVDDIADTCGTVLTACHHLFKGGAVKVYVMVVHGILSGPAIERINESNIEGMVVTNTLPQQDNLCKCPKLKCIDVSMIFTESIRRSHLHESVSMMSVATSRRSIPGKAVAGYI